MALGGATRQQGWDAIAWESEILVGMPRAVAACVSAIVGTALWFAFVVAPSDDQTTNPLFWWLMLGSAIALGVVWGRERSAEVTFGLGLPPLLLSPWTAPRGDGDGLWVLWIPFLFGFVLVLGLAVAVGNALRGRLRRDG